MPENNLRVTLDNTYTDEVITYNREEIANIIPEGIFTAPTDGTPAPTATGTWTEVPRPWSLTDNYKEKELKDEILFSKDGKQVGKLTIDNTRITFDGDADESAMQFFNSLRHVNGTYIRKIHKALEAYRDIPVNGEYMAEYALQMINNPYPLEIEKRFCL
jgi:hypothetical protein